MHTRAKACLGVAVFVAYLSTNAATLAGELVRFESAPVHVGQLQQRLARERGEAPKAADTIEGYLAKPEGDGHSQPLWFSMDAMDFRKMLRSSSLNS